MAFDRHFTLGLALRLALVFALGAAALLLGAQVNHYAATLVAGLLMALAFADLVGFVRRGNREMARFVEAVHADDLSQSFSPRHVDVAFRDLADTLQAAMERQRRRAAQANERQHLLEAMLDDAPTALLLFDDDRVSLVNKAARALFAGVPGVRLSDFSAAGARFVEALRGLKPGDRQLSQLDLHGQTQRVMLLASDVRTARQHLRLVGVQPVQSELETVEMSAWRDLVRVLTHEIMNSMTPVTSLARSAAELMRDLDATDGRIADARQAVEIVARRAEGLMTFVQSYRALTVAPAVRRQKIAVPALVAEMARLFAADWPPEQVRFMAAVDTGVQSLDADPDLIGQVLINLLRNAAQAATEFSPDPEVRLAVSLGGQNAVCFDVSDNGPGVPEDRRREIFLPFYTTKPAGTGIGLSLSRQIAIAHGGSLTLQETDAPGATLRLSLPA